MQNDTEKKVNKKNNENDLFAHGEELVAPERN